MSYYDDGGHRCPWCGDRFCDWCDEYDADIDRRLLARLHHGHIEVSVHEGWEEEDGTDLTHSTWRICGGYYDYGYETGRDTWAMAFSPDECLSICDGITVPSGSHLWVPPPRGYDNRFTMVSFNDIRRGVELDELTDEYRAYAGALFAAGIRNTRVWREAYDAGLDPEYAIATFVDAA